MTIPQDRRSPRLRWRLPAVALAFALVATACGDDGDSTDTAAGSSDCFPVTIEHTLGTAVINEKPQRVVALSEADEDAALALGIQPIAVVETLGGDEALPWTAEARSGDQPTVLEIGDSGVNLEKVASLKPDVILAGSSYFIDDQYDLLAKIAPTTAYENDAAATSPWQTTMRQVGRALDCSDKAEEVVEHVEGVIEGIASDHPELEGVEFAFISVWDTSTIGVLRSEEDSGVKLLSELGMQLASTVTAIDSDEFAVQLSLERTDVLETDVLLGNYGEEGLQEELAANPLFGGLDVVERGSHVVLERSEFWGIRNPTVLSLPYVLERIVPRISEAAEAAAAAAQ